MFIVPSQLGLGSLSAKRLGSTSRSKRVIKLGWLSKASPGRHVPTYESFKQNPRVWIDFGIYASDPLGFHLRHLELRVLMWVLGQTNDGFRVQANPDINPRT